MNKFNAPDMTAEEFNRYMGYLPKDDDLDRVNCPDAGKLGHLNCGWNVAKDCPMFIDSLSK